MSSTLLEAVSEAIQKASDERVYGLYDYSRYPGDCAPHVVTDERTRQPIARYHSRDTAAEYHAKLAREHIALAAITAVVDWTQAHVKAATDLSRA